MKSSHIVSILQKIKSRGFAWLMRRTFQELCAPKNFPGKMLAFLFKMPLYWLMIKPSDKIKNSFYAVENKKIKDALLLVYDLQVEPITYNFIFALAIASNEARKKNLPYLDVLIVKGDYHDGRVEDPEYEQACPIATRRWRIQSILLAAPNLVVNFRHLFYVDKKQARDISTKYPQKYPFYYTTLSPTTHFPVDAVTSESGIHCLRADAQSLKIMREWLSRQARERFVITISLRQSLYCADRNSNVENWLNFARSLDAKKYYVVFVLDTEIQGPYLYELGGFDCCIAASINIQLRMALYELSTLCLGVNNGPMALCWFNEKCAGITFKIVTESVAQATVKTALQNGFIPGKNPSFLPEKQKWVWGDDDLEVIQDNVQSILDSMEISKVV